MSDLIPITCEARLMGFSKQDRRDGEWTELKFHIHPDDTPHALFLLPLKTHIKLSISGVDEAPTEPADAHTGEPEHPPDPRLDDAVAGIQKPADALPAPEATPTPQEPARLKGGARAKWAGILCGDEWFQKWLFRREIKSDWPGWAESMTAEGHATGCVRWLCGVESRAELDDPNNPEPGRIWDGIERDWRAYRDGRTDDALETQRDRRPV